MGAYILHRLLLMIPTFIGILVINFGILRMNGQNLTTAMQADVSSRAGLEGLKIQAASRNIENYIDRFRRAGNDLPALWNTRGWLDKERIVRELRQASPGSSLSQSRRSVAEKNLWLYGHFAVQPLYQVLIDPALRDLHPAASKAFVYCAYTTVDLSLAKTMSATRLDGIQARNDLLRNSRIEAVDEPGYATKRQQLLSFYERDPVPWQHSAGRSWKAFFCETGFVDFNHKLFTGNLWSESKQEYAFTIIGQRWYVSFGLNFISIVLAWAVSIPLGIRSARRRNSLEDKITSNGLFLMWSLPSFFIGTLLLHHLCTVSIHHPQLFPNKGLSDDNSVWFSTPRYLLDLAYHAALPLLVLSYSSFTSLSRYMRGNLLDQLQSDYIRTARAKGCSEDQIIYGHAVRNSMLTMITLAAGLLSDLFGGFVIVEFIFSIQGLGSLTLDAALQEDAPLLMASTVISVLLLLFGILIADLLYAVVDPRLRNRYG
jgi:peptide/nickel transport system permease protein